MLCESWRVLHLPTCAESAYTLHTALTVVCKLELITSKESVHIRGKPGVVVCELVFYFRAVIYGNGCV